MVDTRADTELAAFFASLLTDPTEKKILQLILEGTEESVIVERLLDLPSDREKAPTSNKGGRS